MKRVVVDPITRIEGHLRVEVTVDEASGKVQDALSSGTAWRGRLEPINARLASSFSRTGIRAVATETKCFGETSR